MKLTRRDLLKAGSAVAGALAASRVGLFQPHEVLAAGGTGQPVVWLQGQSCSGCSISLMNSIHTLPVDELLTKTLAVKYHAVLMSASGPQAIQAAEADRKAGGYILVVEGAIPTGANGAFCTLWPGMSAVEGLRAYAKNASMVIAVGTCACFGGVAGGNPNPTAATGVRKILTDKTVINIPGCPAHPDWVVGTIAGILKTGKAPDMDSENRPLDYFKSTVHSKCKYEKLYPGTGNMGDNSCQGLLGCRGPVTYGDCSTRFWNSGAPGMDGVNWCSAARSACQGCTQPTYPDGMSPFYLADGSRQVYCGACHRKKQYFADLPARHRKIGPGARRHED